MTDAQSQQESGAAPPRRGMPAWGWVLIGCGGAALLGVVLLGVIVAIAIPNLQRSRQSAMRVNCMSNLRQIGLACQMYAADSDVFPPDLAALQPTYVDNAKVYWCRAAGNYRPGRVSYGYLPGRDPGLPAGFVLAFDESPDNHEGQGVNVLYCDGRVEWLLLPRFADFEALIKAQDEVVARIRRDPKKRDEFLREYEREHPETVR